MSGSLWHRVVSEKQAGFATIDLGKVFKKPGKQWTASEVQACVTWLYREEYSFLISFIQRRLAGSREDAEDVWQQFVTNSLASIIYLYDPERGRSFQSWLLYRLNFQCKDTNRTLQRKQGFEMSLLAEEVGSVDEQPLQDRVLESQDIYLQLRQHLSLEEQRLLESYLAETPLREIARKANVPIGTIKSRLYTLREKTQQLLHELRTSGSHRPRKEALQ